MNPVERICQREMLGEPTPDDVRYLLDVATEAQQILDERDRAQHPDAEQDWTDVLIDLRLRRALTEARWVA